MVGKSRRVQIRLTGTTGEIDGYAEMILGVFALSNVLLARTLGKKRRAGNVTQIYMDLQLRAAPLGNLGEDDIPDYEGDLL